MQNPRPECAAHASQSKRGHPRPALTVLSPCMQMQLQGLGALPAHFPLAAVVGNHALTSHPTMQNRSRTGSVKAVTQRPNVETVPAPCRGTQRQAHGVVCGAPRPQKSRYHVERMREWTCEACTVKTCGKCGQLLSLKAKDGAWCQACAFPPCDGCGRSRPRTHTEYHAQVMPTWTCADCSRNQQTGVPKKRLRRS